MAVPRRLRPPLLGLALALALPVAWSSAQEFKANEDEAKVPHYTLPDPLRLTDGTPVRDADAWRSQRRPQLLALFESQMFGKAPGRPANLRCEVLRTVPEALGGQAIRKEVRIHFSDQPDGPSLDLALYLPRTEGPHPVFLGLNFGGNHAVDPDPSVPLARGWLRNDRESGITENQATEASRGKEASRWPLGLTIARGYGVATAYYGDIDPDFEDGFQNGVHPLFYRPGQTRPEPDEWGSIAAWAWGLSRALDYLETDPQVDAKRVAVMGHSRLGKTALWAGARDERFALVIANDSGEGGAALARRRFGETTWRINTSFPHWFAGNYKHYNNREDDLPFDAHELIGLVAPRPVLVHSATEDLWADPRGEFLGAQGADSVYRLLGTDGLATRDMPGPGVLVWSRIGYFLRPGKHDVTDADWASYLDFADRHLRRGTHGTR